jgi:2-polyprenyl-6-methoxyphenol hydroxylase-like FAD-dependent oxidoreductase
MCAIDAKKYFKSVTIVEKRGAYTRTNVPVLQDDIKQHLKDLKLQAKLGSTTGAVPTVPFAKLEEALWEKAEKKGVEMLRGYVVEGLFGQQKKADGMYKSMALTLREWDNTNKAISANSGGIALTADLLVVASGGGASADPIMKRLGFQWEELKAKNYAAYGIFEPGSTYAYQDDGSGRPVFDSQLKNDIRPTVLAVVPGGTGSGRTGLTTSDHNYLLVTLAGVTKRDYKALQDDTNKLRKLLISVGKTMEGTVLHRLKTDVDRNVALFKISVKRARQFYSPEYPAVLVGDAAVTPHPETGSGLVTGFRGFVEISALFKALSETHRSEDTRALFLNFDQSYELSVASKALKGTFTILDNLHRLVLQFKIDVVSSLGGATNRAVLAFVRQQEQIADALAQDLQSEMDEATGLHNVLEGKPAPNLDASASVSRLWARINQTWREIKDFTSDISLLDDRLRELESQMVFT